MYHLYNRRSFIKKLIYSLIAFKFMLYNSNSLAESSTEVWGQCPRGLQYDPYPGKCSRYIDTNNDGYCDYSEPPPKTKSSLNSYVSKKAENFNNTKPLFGDDIAEAADRKRRRSITESYNTGTLSILAILFSLISGLLVRKKVIKKQTLLKICNFVLALSFVVSAVLGMILSLKYDGLIKLPLPSWVLFLHVEFGIVFCFLAILHLALNWKSMLYLFNLNGKKN